MSSAPEFIIDAVGWHLKRLELGDQPEDVYFNFKMLTDFLAVNGLFIASEAPEINDGYVLKSSDLTAEGLLVLRNGYERWQNSYDSLPRAKNVRALEKELQKLRNQ